MTELRVKEPAPSTLARYGFVIADWRAIYDEQKGLCAVCGKDPVRLVIDHEHVRGWKNMAPEERKLYVRGLCCPSCNHYVLTRYADARKHRQAADYLDRYAARRPTEQASVAHAANGRKRVSAVRRKAKVAVARRRPR